MTFLLYFKRNLTKNFAVALADISEHFKAEMAGLDEKKQKKIFLTDKTR